MGKVCDRKIPSRIQASLEPIYIEFPHLRGDVIDLIYHASGQYVVFIDAEGELDWETTDEMDCKLNERTGEFHKILADVDILANQPGVFYFSTKMKRAFMWHLGRAVVLILEGQNLLARNMVVFASRYSNARLLEISKKWQQTFSLIIYLIALISFMIFVAYSESFSVGDKTVINTVFYGCTGVVLSSIRNLGKWCYSGVAGRYLHFL